MLPITPKGLQTAHSKLTPDNSHALHHPTTNIHPAVNLATFTHSVQTHVNDVKFAHQSLCNPKILDTPESGAQGLLQRVPKFVGEVDPEISKT
jgi:hypothetical protein